MSSPYIEDPVEPIVGVHWARKKKHSDDNIPPGIPGPPFACGSYLNTTQGFAFWPNYFSLQNYGLWWLTQATDGETLVWLAVTTTDEHGRPTNLVPYLWGPTGVSGFTIQGRNLFIGLDTSAQQTDIRVWRNANPLTFNPCTMGYDASVTFTGLDEIGELEVVATQPNEDYDPIVSFIDTGSNCEPSPCYFQVQAHCAEEFDNTFPPQGSYFPTNDPAWAGKIIGTKQPGSIFADPGFS